MDGTPDYTITMAHMSEHWAKLDFPTVTPLEFNLHGVPIPFTPNKRTCITRNPPFNNDGSALVFGLGLSSNSCTTMCLGRENEEDSSIDLNLSINFNADDKKPSDPKFPIGNLNATNKRKPVLDLELSLSTANAESDATTIPDKNPSEDEGSTPSHSKSVPKRKTRAKTCGHEGCTRGARGASALCIGHGGGRRCQRDGCRKGAEGRTVFCKAHGGGRRCQHLGCTKSAEGRTDHCIAHGGGRRCSSSGCSRAARGRSGLCIRHGGGKRCRAAEGCTRSAEGASGLCISHGGGRRCLHPSGCGKGAQGKTSLCKAHGGGKRCEFPGGCGKGAEGSTPFCKAHGGGKRCAFPEGCGRSVHGGTAFCVGHGGGKRCAENGCTKSARGKTSHCVRHGGGRRCAFPGGCGKSAQGRTDRCKAHGGGKLGLYAAQVRGKDDEESTSVVRVEFDAKGNNNDVVLGDGGLEEYSLPEGRVHGGGLMAMLRGGAACGREGNRYKGLRG